MALVQIKDEGRGGLTGGWRDWSVARGVSKLAKLESVAFAPYKREKEMYFSGGYTAAWDKRTSIKGGDEKREDGARGGGGERGVRGTMRKAVDGKGEERNESEIRRCE